MGNNKLVVCLAGMPGAGKSTIAAGLRDRGFEVVTMGDVIRAEAKKRGLEPTRENLGKMMIGLRERLGPGAVAELIRPQLDASESAVIIVDGIRSTDELKVLKKFYEVRLLAVHASADARFGFLRERGRPDDPQTKEHFEERDSRELGVGISDPIALSDHAISNIGLTRDGLVEESFNIIRGWMR